MSDKEMNDLLCGLVNSEHFDALREFVEQKNLEDAQALLGMDLSDPKATQKQGAVQGRKELLIELEYFKKIK